jgi:hypothetical protein
MSTLLLLNLDEFYENLSPLKDNIVSKSYSSLIYEDLYRHIISRKNYSEARKISLDYFRDYIRKKFLDFTITSLNEKYKDSNLKESLISLKNVIFFQNDFFNNNFIGIELMKLRDKFIIEKKERELLQKKQYVNKIYSIYKTLSEEYRDAKNDLSCFLIKNEQLDIDEILKNRYIENNEIHIIDLDFKLIDEDEELNFLLKNPSKLVNYIRVKYRNEYNSNIKELNRLDLLSTYIDLKSMPGLKYKEEKRILIKKLYELNHVYPLIERLEMIYSDYNYKYKLINIDQTEIDDIQKRLVESETTEKPEKPETTKKLETTEIINSDSIHNPYYNYNITIDKLFYPNIIYYIFKKIYDFLEVDVNSYNLLKNDDSFKNLDELNKIFEYYYNKFIYIKVTNELKNLLDIKYKYTDIPSQYNRLLLSTKNKYNKIVFNDKEDFILGEGVEGRGNNFFGNYLETLREDLFKKYTSKNIDFKYKKEIKEKVQEEKKSTLEILTNSDYYSYSLKKTKELYYMLSKVKNIDSNLKDYECFDFIYSSFLLCNDIVKSTLPLPTDFKNILKINISELCLKKLWIYMYKIYISVKRIGDINLLSTNNVKLLTNKPYKDDDFDIKKVLPIPNFNKPVESSFDEKTLSEGDKTNIDFRKFRLTEESIYSSLLPKHVKQVEKIFQDWFKDINVNKIIDATAHIGIDSVHFRNIFPNSEIYSYEINPYTFKFLKKNVKDFNIEIFNNNFLDANINKVSFIYIDAPWGGKNYKDNNIDTFELYLGNKNIKDIAKSLLISRKTKIIILKVPFNYKFSDLKNNFIVDRKDVTYKNKISYSLLKLTMSEKLISKFLIKPLIISSFENIFDKIKDFKINFNIDENAINLAFNLLNINNTSFVLDKNSLKNDFSYHDIIMNYLVYKSLEESLNLSSIMSFYIDKIISNINEENVKKQISRVLLFSKKNKNKKLKKLLKVKEDEIENEIENEMEIENERGDEIDDDLMHLLNEVEVGEDEEILNLFGDKKRNDEEEEEEDGEEEYKKEDEGIDYEQNFSDDDDNDNDD